MLLFLVFAFQLSSATINASLIYANGSNFTVLEFDRYNSTLNSMSYKDNSILNANAYLKVCSDDSSEILNKYMTLAYASQSGNISINILNLYLRISHIDSSNCSYPDVDISSYLAWFPGRPTLLISDTLSFNSTHNTTNLTIIDNASYNHSVNYTSLNLSVLFDGNYSVGVSVNDVDGTTSFTVTEYHDSNLTIINNSNGFMVMSLVDSNETVIEEQLVSGFSSTPFNHSFIGGEKLYINGMVALVVKILEPCDTVNESGYYLLNSSAWNEVDDCIIINASDVTVNFANQTVDGDGNLSKIPYKCAVKVLNASRASLLDVRASDYYQGICVYNSDEISLSGTSSQINEIGIYLYNSTNVTVRDFVLANNNSEFQSEGGSTAFLTHIRCSSANFSLDSRDVVVKTVSNPPEDIPGFTNILQWLYLNKTEIESWANIKFKYSLPLPNDILLSSVFTWKHNGTYINGSWQNGNWSFIGSSMIDPVNQYFLTGNISDFSVFAPMGEQVTPNGTINGTGIGTGGGTDSGEGGIPPPPERRTTTTQIMPIPPQLDLVLEDDSITLQQGDSIGIKFNLTNLGIISLSTVSVSGEVRKGWDFTGAAYDILSSLESKQGEVLLKVYDNEIPGTYVVAVRAKTENYTLDIEYLTVHVVPREKLPQLTIIEAATALMLFEHETQEYQMLVKNTGDFDLSNITAELLNCECVKNFSSERDYDLNISKQDTLKFKVTVGGMGKCNCVLVLNSNEYETLAFSPLLIDIKPSAPALPQILPFLVLIWTLITAYVLWKRYRGIQSAKKK